MAKKVMVVDDEPDIRDSVKTILEAEGYEVAIAVNGDDCLKKYKQEKPDLILMDVMMPGTPPRLVIPKIKGVKIAFLSVVRMSDAEKEDLLKKNVVDYIQKPFDVDELVKRVKKIIGK